MEKMYIKLDEDKINRIGDYEIDELWRCIDELFIKYHCKIEIQEDGAHLYLSDETRPEEQTADIGVCYFSLQEADWFAQSVKEWVWIEDDGSEENALEYELNTNPVFRKAYNV